MWIFSLGCVLIVLSVRIVFIRNIQLGAAICGEGGWGLGAFVGLTT